MVRRALLVLCIALMTVFMASCGQTYELQSITVAPSSPNLEGIGSSQALIVTAHYSNTKTQDVTVASTFELVGSADAQAPLAALNLNKSGIVKAVDASCTWTATLESDGTTYNYTTQPYAVTVTYSGFTVQSFVSVASVGGCYDGQKYLAPTPKA